MLQLLIAETILSSQIDFYRDRNQSVIVEINLSLNVATSYCRNDLVITNRFLSSQKRSCHRRNQSVIESIRRGFYHEI